MSHEISQLDIPDRELLASNAQPSVWTEIGEAQVTHTIFGRAKVRIIRKHDNHHVVFWLTGIVAAAIAIAFWLGLFTPQQTEPVQNEETPPIRAKAKVSPPAQSENIVSPALPPAAIKEPNTQAQIEIDKPAIIPKSAPQPAKDLQSPELQTAKPLAPQPKPLMVQKKPVVAQPKPVTSRPLAVGKPQTAPSAAGSSATNQMEVSPPAKPLPLQPMAAPVVATPRATPAQSASSPAAVIQLSAPLVKEETPTPTPAPAVTNQTSAPVNVPSK